ncbi:hypothetical protein BG015_011283 [Linnemannia schmuckeri]|uniref:Uncharacterized protein n=1 Tax=Linnemannia schmuckeri TaxID=64567 RepID=A0A9P5RVC7_9FUNG|nr:hypothetical protein BG015_011283 [Linnemannia schmuckeri]
MSARPAARAALEVTDGSDDDTTPVSESATISSKICPAVRRAIVVGGRYASILKESTESTEDDGCSSRARVVGDGDAVMPEMLCDL